MKERMIEVSNKELIFINEYLKHYNKTKAYQVAYGYEIVDRVSQIERQSYQSEEKDWYSTEDEEMLENGYKYLDYNTLLSKANELLAKDNVRSYINRRIIEMEENTMIADKSEVLAFYTSVMRGEVLDQFGLEASLSDRLKAADQLAKHLIVEPQKLAAKDLQSKQKVTLNFNSKRALS